jgi:hypothetical protein
VSSGEYGRPPATTPEDYQCRALTFALLPRGKLIHRSAWKGNFRKFACRILHRSPSGSREGGFWSHLRHVCEAYMLCCCIKIRRHE